MWRPRIAAIAVPLLWVGAATGVEVPQRGTDQIAHFCLVAFGGPERWQQVHELRFTNIVTRYRPGNEPFKERAAEVYLRLRPRRQCRIESFDDHGKAQTIIYDGEDIAVLTDGRPDTDATVRKRALRRALSTLYLAELPFNLDDPGVLVVYRGEGKIDGKDTYHLRAQIRGGEIFSPADIYDYYINTDTYMVERLVYTSASDGASYIVRWSELQNLDGILRPVRWDYMASPRQKATSIEYKDLQFNPGLADSLFEIAAPGASSPK